MKVEKYVQITMPFNKHGFLIHKHTKFNGHVEKFKVKNPFLLLDIRTSYKI